MGEADFGAFDLTVSGLTAEMVADLPDVGDAGGGDGVALGLQPTGHVDRCRTVAPRGAGFEELDRSTWRAEHEIVVVHQLRCGEAIVQLDEVEIGRASCRERVCWIV